MRNDMERTRNLPAQVERFLKSLPLRTRLGNWLRGRRFLSVRPGGQSAGQTAAAARGAKPGAQEEKLIVVAHSVRDANVAADLRTALEKDWFETPPACREDYEDILAEMPHLVVVQLRRDTVCDCLGHRHFRVRERLFSRHLQKFHGYEVGEVDLAHRRIAAWEPWPLMSTAFDSKFIPGTRLTEFRRRQFRLRLLSVLLHEANHLARPSEHEASVLSRSVNFYRNAMVSYFETSRNTLSFTMDRSFSRLG